MRNSILILLVLLLYSCGSQQGSQEKRLLEKPVVIAVNYPLTYFAQRIGGDLIRLEYPIPSDVDPAFWIPDDENLSMYQSADIILDNGADYAKWMNNVSLPTSRIVNTTLQAEERYIPLTDIASHSHGPEGEHEHGGYAFTTWLDFQIAIEQAKAIKEIFIRKMPESKVELEENFASLERDLLSLHKSMAEASKQFKGQNIVGSHPVFQYLSEAYGLNIESVHFEPGDLPTRDQWKKFDQLLETHASSIMIWEDEPIPEIKEILAKKGVEVKVFNPCGNQTARGDFIEIMNRNIQNLQNNP